MVALTFDDGPNSEKTKPVLDILDQYHVKATFFVLGVAINEKTGPLLQRMVDMGCEIGIHGLDHRIVDRVAAKNLKMHLQQASAIISQQIEGGYTPKLMRPPAGRYSSSVLRVAEEEGLALIMWSVDTKDWKNRRDKILYILQSQTQDGAIILFHDKGSWTPDVLKQYIPLLLEQGYDLVTVSELIARNGASVVPGTVYRSVEPQD